MKRTEFSPIKFRRAKDVKSFYTGRKTTELGRASVNISKHSDGDWHVTGFSVKRSHPHSYINVFGELTSETAHEPHHVAITSTYRDAKSEAEFWINRQVCMKSLDGEIMYDENYNRDED